MNHAVFHSSYRLVLQVRHGVVVDDDLYLGVFEQRLDPRRAESAS